MTEYFLKSFYAESLFGMLRSFFHRVIFSSVFLQEKMLGHLCWKRELNSRTRYFFMSPHGCTVQWKIKNQPLFKPESTNINYLLHAGWKISASRWYIYCRILIKHKALIKMHSRKKQLLQIVKSCFYFSDSF